MLSKHHLRRFILLGVILAILILPQTHAFFITQQFTKAVYPDGTLVLTTTPTANFPRDWQYCYMEQNNIDALCIFYNVPNTPILTDHIDEQMALADIYINWDYTTITENSTVYFDFEFEAIATNMMDDYNAEIVLVFSDLVAPQDSIYRNLGGYARVQSHFSIVFTPMLQTSMHQSALGLHEISHLLGYWHSDNPDDVMYEAYSGLNNDFTQETIDDLYDLHH